MKFFLQDDKKDSQRFKYKKTEKLNLFIATIFLCTLKYIGCFIPAILCIMRGVLDELWEREKKCAKSLKEWKLMDACLKIYDLSRGFC